MSSQDLALVRAFRPLVVYEPNIYQYTWVCRRGDFRLVGYTLTRRTWPATFVGGYWWSDLSHPSFFLVQWFDADTGEQLDAERVVASELQFWPEKRIHAGKKESLCP